MPLQQHVSVACQIVAHSFSGSACASSCKPTKALSTQLMEVGMAVRQRRSCAGCQAYTGWFSKYNAESHSGHGQAYFCNLKLSKDGPQGF